MSVEVDVRAKMNRAWLCILEQHSKFIQSQYHEHGPGMALLVLLDRVTSGNNCEFNYVTKDSKAWNFLIDKLPDREAVLNKYIPEEHIIVNVTIEAQGELVSEVKIFTNETLSQVPYFKGS